MDLRGSAIFLLHKSRHPELGDGLRQGVPGCLLANDPAKSKNSDFPFLITFDQCSDARSLILTLESGMGDETRVSPKLGSLSAIGVFAPPFAIRSTGIFPADMMSLAWLSWCLRH